MAELANTSLLTEDRPGRYSFHDLIRAYAAELLENTDLEIDRQSAPARLLDHYLHSVHAAQVALKPHRRLTAPGPPRPGVTPEQFSDYRSAVSWFISERRVLNAVVSLATDSDFGFPAWQLALTMQPFYRSRGYFHDWMDTMQIALAAAGRDADLPGQGHMLRSLAEASFHLHRHADSLRYLERAQPPTRSSGTPPSTPTSMPFSARSLSGRADYSWPSSTAGKPWNFTGKPIIDAARCARSQISG